MKTIMLTNDDGIDSHGMLRLARAAKRFGDVWVIAPDSQRSAASHSISLHSTVDIFPHDFPVDGVKAFSCTGSPGDCVRVGSLSIMDRRPDVVLSGINFGFNVASDIQYSATAGAAFEASFQGYLAVALSEGWSDEGHRLTDEWLDRILENVIDREIISGRIINVNFPDIAPEKCKGIREGTTVSESMVYKDHYNLVEKLENGGTRWMVEGVHCYDAEEGTDYRALLDGYISIGLVNNVGY